MVGAANTGGRRERSSCFVTSVSHSEGTAQASIQETRRVWRSHRERADSSWPASIPFFPMYTGFSLMRLVERVTVIACRSASVQELPHPIGATLGSQLSQGLHDQSSSSPPFVTMALLPRGQP